MPNKQTNPLMIRGDRLLLALDVLACWADYGQTTLKRSRVESVLARWWTAESCDHAQRNINGSFAVVLWPIHRLLRSCSDHTAAVELPIANIETFLSEEAMNAENARAIAQLMTAIASGKLTEADFQEVK